ncbi:MAG TPA: ATP-binding cassette domain-containing protein, partial [Burkholderiales bacterium]|nr:ATP-binding cassette domain-containing protein [Burkholderiales bacterium]
MSRPVIDIRDLSFAWAGQDASCLDIESLQVEAGERVFIHGPSGSGKSTLLGLLGGVLAPQRGSINVLGTRLEKLRPAQRDRFRADHIGFLFQLFNLIPYLSVIDNVLLAGQFSARRRAQALASGATLREEATRLLADLGL